MTFSVMDSVTDLATHTGYLLRMVSNAVSRDFARKLVGEGVTVAEWVMMRWLYDQTPTTPASMAKQMGMTRGAITKLADRLLKKGLVEISGNPDRRGGHLLSLSITGTAKVPVFAALADENDATFFSVLTDADHQLLRATLQALIGQHKLTATPVD